MRYTSTLIPALFAVSAGLSQPVPDTTDWHAYFPLQIGNEWQYHVTFDEGTEWHDGFRIEGDTLLEGETYFVLRSCVRYDNEPPSCTEIEYLRYDENAALILERLEIAGQPRDYWWDRMPCQLDADFNAGPVLCEPPGGDEYGTSGGVVAEYVLALDTLREVTLKEFRSITTFFTWMINGIGKVYRSPGKATSRTESLIFARINGIEYGERNFTIVVGTEPEPGDTSESAGIAVLYPNPAREHITLIAKIDWPERVGIRVYDLRGREVLHQEARTSGAQMTEITIDISNLPTGTYLVRMTTVSGVTSTRMFSHVN